MTTYVYETIPAKAGEKSRYVELKQSMSDTALTKHPETGEPIRRVVMGGIGIVSSKNTRNASKGSGSACGTGCGCH